jgi:hypothetical protein
VSRPPLGTLVRIKHTGAYATVVPTGRRVPDGEVNVMHHNNGSIQTVQLGWIEIVNNTPAEQET